MGSEPDRGMLVTVLTTARNAERYIAETIESIQAQTFREWEYIIIDDASSDGTRQIAERYADADARIRVVTRNEGGGPYVAANHGFAQARGRYVARIDADDIAVPDRLERQLAFLAANPGLRACASEVDLLENGRVRPMTLGFPTSSGALKWRLFFRTFLPSTTLIERSAWAEVGGFRELPLSQDLRMWCDLARRHWLGALAEPLVRWRVHDDQLSAQRYDLQQALAVDVLSDHLVALGVEDWNRADVDALRWIGVRPSPMRAARRLIKRWDALWRSDASLSDHERCDLERLTRHLLTQHAKVVLKDKLGSRALGRALLDARTRAQKPSRA